MSRKRKKKNLMNQMNLMKQINPMNQRNQMNHRKNPRRMVIHKKNPQRMDLATKIQMRMSLLMKNQKRMGLDTPPHHHLCSFDEKKGARRDRLRQFEIYPNPTVRKTPKKSLSNARNARPILPLKKRPNISLQNEQKYCQEMVFSLKKTKKNPFFPL